jgi:hypothetical protein
VVWASAPISNFLFFLAKRSLPPVCFLWDFPCHFPIFTFSRLVFGLYTYGYIKRFALKIQWNFRKKRGLLHHSMRLNAPHMGHETVMGLWMDETEKAALHDMQKF